MNVYLTHYYWAATCEGQTHEVCVSFGQNEREAKLRHFDKFRSHLINIKENEKEMLLEMIHAIPFKDESGNRNPDVEQLLKRFFNPEFVEYTLRADDNDALIEMSFVHYVNYS